MSQKKIIFLVIIGLIFIAVFITMTYISQQNQAKNNTKNTVKIWITDGTSESYADIIDGFKKYAPEYTNTDFIIEKQTNDTDRYRTLLLSMFTEGSAPDIFMLKSGEDAILDTKIEPIPSRAINISDFDKRYDDIFQDLIFSTGSGKDKETYIRGVPLGFETLGVFYNKSLIREVPKTWNELENLYREVDRDQYASNLGLGPTYTPNMIDILPLWFNELGTTSYSDVYTNKEALNTYLGYGSLSAGSTNTDYNEENSPNPGGGISEKKTTMLEQKYTTLDLFMQGDIAMIIGYPSLILELEKSSKRVGTSSNEGTILTDRIPQVSSQSKKNIGRYTYFGVSKYSNNGMVSAKFLEYLMTPEAQRIYMRENPYIIPAQIEFYATAESNSLSENMDRAKLTPFIPTPKEKVSVFQYGLKSRFEQYLRDGIDTPNSPDTEAITKKISSNISCEINSSLGKVQSKDCQNE